MNAEMQLIELSIIEDKFLGGWSSMQNPPCHHSRAACVVGTLAFGILGRGSPLAPATCGEQYCGDQAQRSTHQFREIPFHFWHS
jgi:hypothetical protein